MITENTSDIWDGIVKAHSGHPLQLSGWGRVKESTSSWQVIHAIHQDRVSNRIDFAQILIHKTPLGKLGYIPRGQNLSTGLLHELRAVMKRERLFMLRFEPNVDKDKWLIKIGTVNAATPKLQTARDHILLTRTIQLDLTQTPEALLTAMDAKTRQYIRRGERDVALGVRPAAADDLPRILEIYHVTAKRAGFPLHRDIYYQTVLEQMGKANHIFVAAVDDNVEAFLWCVKTPAVCVELYGGATDTGLRSRANYLLKWQTILAAQNDGCKTYDLNGLLNDGISKFKLGFSGGAETALAPTGDLVANPLLYFLFTTFLPLAKKLQ